MLPNQVKEKLLKLFKIETASPSKQEQFLTSLEALAKDLTIKIILNQLSETDAQEFIRLNQTDQTGEKAMEFAKGKIPDLENQLTKELEKEIHQINL